MRIDNVVYCSSIPANLTLWHNLLTLIDKSYDNELYEVNIIYLILHCKTPLSPLILQLFKVMCDNTRLVCIYFV